jgi:MerR family transcriptional regulator, light-induced transcriptional regulator
MEASGGQAEPGSAGGAPQAPLPTLTVAAVARRLGVAPPTLRTWDRRYGLGPSAHTAGAHRRYSPADVARLMVMRRLTLQGVPPAVCADGPRP